MTSGALLAFHPKPEFDVQTAIVSQGPIARQIAATGALQAVTTVSVGTQVSGVVQSIAADFNSVVVKGQLLARLDPSLFEATLNQARASLDDARAGLRQSQANLIVLQTAEEDAREKVVRARALAVEQILDRADLDSAEIALSAATAGVVGGQAQIEDAEAAVRQAEAAVEEAALNVDHTMIRAPIGGRVVNRSIEVGQTLAASVQVPELFRIASDLHHMQVQVDVDESDIAGIALGVPAKFTVDSYPRQTFRGTVSQVRLQPVAQDTAAATTVASSTAPVVSTQVATVVTYTVIIDVENPELRFLPGMTAEVTMTGLQRVSAVRVPNAALTFRPTSDVLSATGDSLLKPSLVGLDSRWQEVWRFDGRHFDRIPMKAGLADERWTELTAGNLRPGDSLVTGAAVRERGLFQR